MGLDRPKKLDPETKELLTDIANAIASTPSLPQHRFPFLTLTTTRGRTQIVMVTELVYLEELSNGNTRVHMSTRRDFTVVDSVADIVALLAGL